MSRIFPGEILTTECSFSENDPPRESGPSQVLSVHPNRGISMKRWCFASLILLSGGALILWSATTTPSATKLTDTKGKPQSETTVRVTPWGPTQEMMDSAKAKLVSHPEMRRFLRLSRNRLVSFELVQDVDKTSTEEIPPN